MVGTMRRMKMSGEKINFKSSYDNQIHFQENITGVKCPGDNLDQFGYHIKAMVEELGEVIKIVKLREYNGFVASSNGLEIHDFSKT